MKVSTILAFATTHLAAAAPTVNLQARALDDPEVPKIDDPKFQETIMNAHYYWRAVHCAQRLTWDPEVAKAALESVAACTKHPQHDRGGSNLSSVTPAPSKYDVWMEMARTIVHGWHEEETQYDYNTPHYEGRWGHFSQLVWRDSSRIGCALAHCPDDVEVPARLYCFYERAGNNIAGNAFEENIWPPVCADPDKAETEALFGTKDNN